MCGLTYLSLCTGVNDALVRILFGSAYGNSLWHVHKLFSAYFHELYNSLHENNLTLF